MNQKHLPNISSECKCKFDGTKCNSNQWWNNKCWCEYKNYHICEKDYVSNSATCNCENWKYLASIMYDFMYDFSYYLWWNYKIISQRNKNYSNKC